MTKLKRMLFLKFARKFNKSDNQVQVPTIISENTVIKGDIVSDGIIHVDGNIEGDISCMELVIGIKGSVTGSVTVQNMHLYGTLRGKAVADNLFVSKTAKLIGDAKHNSIAIEPGAYIDGHCMRAGAPIPAEQGKADLMLVDKTSTKPSKVG